MDIFDKLVNPSFKETPKPIPLSKESFKNREILTSEWKPSHEQFEYPKEFVRFIDSINSGWQNKIYYEPLELYIAQARYWLEDDTDIIDLNTEEEQREWLEQEIERGKANSLYFCNKYGYIKEDKAENGMLKYHAWDAQQVLLFLFDCGYSFMIGKGRQIGFTTTMCLAGMIRVNLFKSYFIKFVTHTIGKGEEIFNDKVKWAFTKIPSYIAQDVKNWTGNIMSFDKKGERKGRDSGGGSRFQVDTPKIDAINGGSPSAVFVDEIGLMSIFGDMMREGRPALFKYDPVKKKMIMQQQFIAWGTSGEMDAGGAVFESEFNACLKNWKEKNYAYGIIPLFFNAYARVGVTKEHIENERLVYESKKGSKDEDKARVQFFQHYPIVIDDMFIRKSRTLVPIFYCNKRLDDIYNKTPAIEYGYFEPIMDVSQPTPDLFTPYKIIDARWVQTSGEDDSRTTAIIINHPPQGEVWKHRYYQGTDPINSETGHSKMSSAIWDSLTNSVSSIIFFRERKFKQCYLQVLLQSLYYDQEKKGGVKELIESNIGDMHLDFQETHGFKHKFTSNASIPDYMQTPSGKWFGINNRTNTASHIIAKLEEILEAYSENIDVPWFWTQLKTFIEKDLNSPQGHRQTRYQAADLRYDYDDAIFSIIFAYINAVSHNRLIPINIKGEELNKKTRIKIIQNRQTNWSPRRAEVDSKGRLIRYL
jgi:hypothetical protein